MYFDAYLKGRNHNPPNNYTQTVNTTTQPHNKFSTFRPPNPQTNLTINKPPSFNQIRIDHNKPNSSAHIFLSVAKNTNLPHKINNNHQVRPQNNINNLSAATVSRQQLTDDKKYICHSPLKINNRTSAGLPYEEIPQNSKFNYRRSQSINDLTSNQSFQDSSFKTNLSTLRTTLEYQPPSDNRPLTNSPPQIKFNASNAYPGRVVKKQSIDSSRLLSNRDQRCDYKDYIQSNTFRDNSYQSVAQNKPYLVNYEPNPPLDNYTSKQYEDVKYDFSLRKFDNEAKKTSQETYKLNSYSSIPHAPLQFLKRQSSQQFLKRYGVSRIPQLDKTLDKDIETLKLAHKKSEEVIEKEMSKNVYLNQLFEQKGPLKSNINDKRGNMDENQESKRSHLEEKRLSIQDRIIQHKGNMQQRKQLQAKCAYLQKQIEERKNQLFQKNKELSQKSKSIIQKNKQIQSLLTQTKDLQQKYSSLQKNQEILNEKVLVLQKDISNKDNKIAQLQSLIKQREQYLKTQINQKNSIIEQIKAQLKERVNELQKDINNCKDTISICNQQIKNKQQEHQENVAKLAQKINQQKQQAQIQKENLREHVNKIEEMLLIVQKESVRMQEQRVSVQRSNQQRKNQLLKQIQGLRQGNTLLKKQICSLKKEHQQISQSYKIITQQYLQIGQILQLPPNFNYQKLITRIRQILQPPLKMENPLGKQIQRVQQQHLQRRHVQMSRQLKKVGSRLAGVSIQVQQGSRLLREANNHLFLLNLINLNEKYKYLLDQQQ